MANHPESFKVEIAYALPDLQILKQITVYMGSTVQHAIMQSGILDQFPDVTLTKNKIGIFGHFVPFNTILKPNDRVEIYRSLIVDPKKIRTLRAKKQITKNSRQE